jgi:TonB family protein
MHNSPLSNFSSIALPGPDALPVPLHLGQPTPPHDSDPLGLVDVLRQALDEGTRTTESILRAITDAARILTGAHGTALALQTNGVILCRARSGEIAPELGAPLNVESGISGECLRSASILVCNDAAVDSRVDREACLGLGVRSIVVVPLRGPTGIGGILEAFSTRAYAFGTEQIDALRALAEIAESAYDREGQTPPSPVADSVTPEAIRIALFAPASIASRDVGAQNIERSRAAKFFDEYLRGRRYWVPALVAIAVLLVTMVAWWSWHNPAAETEASATTLSSSTSSAETASRATTGVLPLKPSPAVPDPSPKRTGTKDVLQNAAEIDPEMGGSRPLDSGTTPATLRSEATPEKASLPSMVTSSESESAPAVEVTPNAAADIPDLSANSAALPAFGARVSTGIVEAALVHRVNPIYPAEARIQRLAGSVTLDATVAEDGSVHNLKVVSGPSQLASAATAAVKLWRYNPSTLDGKPIEVQKRITIVFKLP